MLLCSLSCVKKEQEIAPKISSENSENTQIIKPTENSKGAINGDFSGCGYNYVLNESSLGLELPNEREINQITNILRYAGLSQNFDIYSAPIENAVATMINNRRFIIYDPRLMNVADHNSNSYWSSMSILAHEIGHHLQGHTLEKGGSNPEAELEADKFSGHILYKMGATLEQALAAINNFGNEIDTSTHPSKYKRMASIKEGWQEASSQRYESAIPPPPADDKTFASGNYFIDEFHDFELLSEEALQTFKESYIQGDEPLIEGIILNVDEDDPSGGSWAEGFNGYPDAQSMVYTIQITNNSRMSTEDKSYNKVGQRKQYYIPDLYAGQLGNAQVSWLKSLMVPGRKIAFKGVYYGYGAENLIYIKKLMR